MALDLGKSFTELNPNLTRPQPTNPLAAKLNLESQQGLALERGPVGQPRIRTGTFGNLGDIQTSGTGAGDFAVRIGAAPTEMTTPSVFAMSHQLPTLQPVETPAPAIPTAPITTSTATPAPTTPTAPAAAKQVTAPEFMPTLSGPNTAQEMVSEGRNLMNTQGIGGFVQAKGLNRMAQTVNQANEPLIQGQYGLKREAMTANERLEQAKLAEHQKQQNLETWTPDKSITGELIGYGRTKGGRPEYVTKESLMSKPTLAQFLAKARPVNPKATDAELTAHYNATYAQND